MTPRPENWPASLLLVRHAESLGNVARQTAESSGANLIEIAERDMDVPLSERGREQAAALGEWLDRLGAERPTVAVASPYVRARDTARLALAAGGLDDVELTLDERLREREFGIADRLTSRGWSQRYPDQAEARARVGKFYYRAPGGESWCDVGLRVRSFLDSITREYAGERVAVFTHEVVILMFRYVLEHLDEEAVLTAARGEQLANCAVTCFDYDAEIGPRGSGVSRERRGGMRLRRYNEPTALQEAGVPVTREPDAPVAPR